MKNDMKVIMESWRQTNLLEGVVDAIENNQLDDEAIEKIGDKLSDKEGFKLAVQMFSALSQTDPEEMEELGEGAIDWINSKVIQGVIAKDNLVDTLKSDSRFAPVLKLGGPALALAFLYFKQKAGGVDPQDFAAATEIIAKKGKIGLDSLVDSVLTEYVKKLRSHNGKEKSDH